MKYREQRGTLKDSMKTVVELPATRAALAAHLSVGFPTPCPADRITVKPYGGIDPRNGWDTHIVCVNGDAWGYTDGPLAESAASMPELPDQNDPEPWQWYWRAPKKPGYRKRGRKYLSTNQAFNALQKRK